ncbi:hypothetical protein AAFF_G00229810 [Aldrovandia affinis]|uniref:Uncharacterized protein n=1 Tax=Aldrovandia affinis TaxID=143900 RepID=A0AAD7SVR2_9TELE|nr:hypothetical protein AAFF_G00229810 [Aldrovandia affinis]
MDVLHSISPCAGLRTSAQFRAGAVDSELQATQKLTRSVRGWRLAGRLIFTENHTARRSRDGDPKEETEMNWSPPLGPPPSFSTTRHQSLPGTHNEGEDKQTEEHQAVSQRMMGL